MYQVDAMAVLPSGFVGGLAFAYTALTLGCDAVGRADGPLCFERKGKVVVQPGRIAGFGAGQQCFAQQLAGRPLAGGGRGG